MLCVLDGFELEVTTDDAVGLMRTVAAGDLIEADVAAWLTERIRPLDDEMMFIEGQQPGS